jgi:hypothetical protein
MSKLGDGTMTNGPWTKGAPMVQGGDPTGRGAPLHMPLMVGFMVQVHRWGVHPGGAPQRTPGARCTYVGFYKGEASWSPLRLLKP